METTPIFQEILKDIFAGFAVIFGVLFKLSKVILWGFAGLFILLCVFVAHTWYPKWEKWAENLKW
ncbi:MAG: hypothetical protein NTV72_03170 [Candidatus Taylorbacteria bacterium]|nr:hypothetical protein [Candidatus Taylorbacteria bacterium]